MTILATFNNKGGVGKTSITWHLSYAIARLGSRVLVVDADPQANLTATFYDEDTVEKIWNTDESVFGMVQPVIRGLGDFKNVRPREIEDGLTLLPGDMRLAAFEPLLSDSWPCGADGNESALRQLTAPWRGIVDAAKSSEADIVLLDLGPNLGSLTRTYMVMADFVLVPVAPDLFSLQGLRNLGPVLRDWRAQWPVRREKARALDIGAPEGWIRPIGYVLSQHGVYGNRPTSAFGKWINRFPGEFHASILDEKACPNSLEEDRYFLGRIKNYRSLMPMAMEARKPILDLRPADGAIGAHMAAVEECRKAYRQLAKRIVSSLEGS